MDLGWIENKANSVSWIEAKIESNDTLNFERRLSLSTAEGQVFAYETLVWENAGDNRQLNTCTSRSGVLDKTMKFMSIQRDVNVWERRR